MRSKDGYTYYVYMVDAGGVAVTLLYSTPNYYDAERFDRQTRIKDHSTVLTATTYEAGEQLLKNIK